ncbi:biorientation of chromosomes in cell division protein 1-like 1 [Exaiptasia diaphana]|uniref:BOD1/SHG1 domain-containing protein n=1 Tax=Exaiptasia diaphana TaxID=2652724 RepID=A0A913XBN4_EXADI|nr:biorientation of chromosomes in cell division protein 1-like 1 [Exaiptasia diaphana]
MASSSGSGSSNLMQGLDSKSRTLIGKIVAHLKSQGNFDELRRDCLEELDKMESFRQLNQRVESYVATFLSKQEWSDTLSKNQIRDNLRKHVCASETLKSGAQRLITQVIEKRSRAFQTRLEGIVQSFIYTDQEREKQERKSRYQNRNSHHQEPSKPDQEKAPSSEKTSTISDVNDIISQIEHSEAESSTKPESSTSIKPETTTSTQQNKGDMGKLPKSEKKCDVSSPSETSKSTPPSKTNLTKRINPSKRVPPKTASPNPSSPLDKLTETPPRSAHSNQSNSSHSESLQKSAHEGLKVAQVPKKIEGGDAPPHNPDATKETIVSEDIEKSSQETEVNMDTESLMLKVEDAVDSKDDVTADIFVTDKMHERETGVTHEIKAKPTEFDAIENKETDKNIKDEVEASCEDSNDSSNIKNLSPQESDIDDSISDVSSVHTSDLSSFDGEVSSSSESSDDEHNTEEEKQTIKGNKKIEKGYKHKNEDEMVSSDKSGRTRGKDIVKGDHVSGENKRGRPRKDQSRSRSEDKSTARRSRLRRQEEKRSKDRTQTRDKSKRQIKKKRCYSPSSEGTREVCLPSKRSRVNSRD